MKTLVKKVAPNLNCKDCHGRGKIMRTAPMPRANIGYTKRKGSEKKMIRIGTPCHCLRERMVRVSNG